MLRGGSKDVTQKLALKHEPRRAESTEDGCVACRCQAGSIFGDLDADSLIELDRRRQLSVYPTGATIFLQGDQPRAVYCIGAGRVKVSHCAADGRTVALNIATSGDVLGVRPMLLGTPHDLTAEALDETRLCFIAKDDFMDFLTRKSAVSLRLAQKLSAELDEAYRQVSAVALKSTTERVAELILALCQTHGQPGPGGIGLPTNMCQDELAEFLGVSRRSMSRALATLRAHGLITCGRRSIIVRDSAALQKSLASTGRDRCAVASDAFTPASRKRQLAQS
jgi:CRP-like cAMP-binding protein